MKALKVVFFTLLLLVLAMNRSFAQLDVYMNPRVSLFDGKFGKEYTGIGFEFGATLQDPSKPWAGGIHYQGNWLGTIDETPYSPYLHVLLNTFSFHYGAKRSIHKFFHPFAYGVAGMNVLSFTDPELGEEADAFFNTITFNYGLKTGVQLGSGAWRGEIKLDYLRSTRSRYLVADTFWDAYEANADFRDHVRRSTLNNISFGLGVVYVFGLE